MRRFDAITTERLLLRRWLESDREPFAALNGDPETMLFFPSTLGRAASDALVDRIESLFEQQGYGLWALEVAGTGEFIGFTGLNPMPADVPGAGGIEIGWRLARHAWHQG
jgi:RimJ/RimL family protein N-acetyltransferase